MIQRQTVGPNVELIFQLDFDGPVSVVGDFNDWDPFAHPLVRQIDSSTRTVTVMVAPGRYAFRYLADDGYFFDDPDADSYNDNGYGGVHGVVDVNV